MTDRRLLSARARKAKCRPAMLATVAVIVLTTGTNFAQSNARTRRAPLPTSRKAGPVELGSLAPLQEAFRRDQGKIRLLVLISPT